MVIYVAPNSFGDMITSFFKLDFSGMSEEQIICLVMGAVMIPIFMYLYASLLSDKWL